MNLAVDQTARHFLQLDPPGSSAGRRHSEPRSKPPSAAIDPCLSCSTHALGQMPLVVELLAPGGAVLQRHSTRRVMRCAGHCDWKSTAARRWRGAPCPSPPGLEKRRRTATRARSGRRNRPFDLVVFVDASVRAATRPRLEPVGPSAGSPLTHVCSPGEIVALARSLFGFVGRAYLCHIPARDFSNSERLSARAQRFADQAAGEIEHIAGELEHIARDVEHIMGA